ncbi:unnamed protein product [Sphagnum jensenii]
MKAKVLKIHEMVLLKRPCHCGDAWAIVRGTPRKRTSVKCYRKGHVLTGFAARTHMTYKQIVMKARSHAPTA